MTRSEQTVDPVVLALRAATRRAVEDTASGQLALVVGELATAITATLERLVRETLADAARSDSIKPTLLTAEGMAKHLGVPASWLRERARRGAVPYVRVGRYMRFNLDDVMGALCQKVAVVTKPAQDNQSCGQKSDE